VFPKERLVPNSTVELDIWSVNQTIFAEESKISVAFTSEITGPGFVSVPKIKPSEEAATLLKLYNKLAQNIGEQTYPAPATDVDIESVAGALLLAKGKSLVVSGTNDLKIQLIVNAINNLLGNYGKTIDLTLPVNLKQGMENFFKVTAEKFYEKYLQIL